jgi:AAA family ATP:ADP antiporter
VTRQDTRGPLDRLLRVFSDVRAGEAGTVLLLFANLFLLLTAYYIIRTVREPLILVVGGAELRSYASAAQALALVVFIPLYGWVASRVTRIRLVLGVILVFVACIQVFYIGSRFQAPYLGFLFFVWVGIFNNATIALFWSYANDLYRREDGERLFPVIALGGPLGAPLGAAIATRLFDSGVNPFNILQISAALLLLHVALYWIVNRRESGRPGQAAASQRTLEAGPGGFALVLRSPYLRLVALLLILLNFVNSTGEFILAHALREAAAAAAAADPTVNVTSFIGSFSGRYQLYISVTAALMQAFLVSRIVKYLGIAGAILTLPVVALGSYGLIAVGASLFAIRWAKVAENATDYSVMNTGKQLLWLPTTREEKYKAKQAVDSFFVRAGDLLQAGLVALSAYWLHLNARGFALTNLTVCAAWIFVALVLVREHRALVAPPA